MSYDSYTETYTILVNPIRDPSPYARTFNIDRTNRPFSKSVLSAFSYGLGAGLIGITATGITQTIEQYINGRPAIRAPGESILRFFGRHFRSIEVFHYGHRRRSSSPNSNANGKEKELASSEEEEDSEPSNLTEPPGEGSEVAELSSSSNTTVKWATYVGQGVVLGGVRGILSYYGARGLVSDMVFLGFTSSMDSCPFWAEMANNVPLSQLLLDSVPELVHQAVYAFVTGFFCDHWVN